MKILKRVWVGLFCLGWLLILFDYISEVTTIGGVPALTAIGAALVIMVITSLLNWLVKVAWAERSRTGSGPEPGGSETG